MPIGPGKYDDACSTARLATRARGALLIIIDGEHGDGFSCQADLMTTLTIPDVLEDVARKIRASFERGKL